MYWLYLLILHNAASFPLIETWNYTAGYKLHHLYSYCVFFTQCSSVGSSLLVNIGLSRSRCLFGRVVAVVERRKTVGERAVQLSCFVFQGVRVQCWILGIIITRLECCIFSTSFCANWSLSSQPNLIKTQCWLTPTLIGKDHRKIKQNKNISVH